jgi:hypothetical protein
MSEASLEFIKLKLRMQQAIINDKKAQKGRDLEYRRKCREEIENVRNLINNLLTGEK